MEGLETISRKRKNKWWKTYERNITQENNILVGRQRFHKADISKFYKSGPILEQETIRLGHKINDLHAEVLKVDERLR
jgi:hypothetical protein